MKKVVTKVIEYRCPICRASVPIAQVVATRGPWFKPNVEVTVDGDATDYVAHMWAHQQRMT